MTTSTPAGWYDDPQNPNAQRYWDGQNWTPHYQRKPPSAQTPKPTLPPPLPTAVSAAPPPPPPNQAAPPLPLGQQPAGRHRKIVSSIASFVVFVLAILCVRLLSDHHFFIPRADSSPEDQIKAVVQREADNFNNSKFSFNPELTCKAQASDDQHIKDARTLRAQGGTISISVANIHVTGDHATADITMKLAKLSGEPITPAAQFVKEDGRWKDCTPPDSTDNGENN